MTRATFNDGRVLLLGAGRMGAAMLRGWLAQSVPGSAIAIIEPAPTSELQSLAGEAGLRLNPSSAEVGAVDVLVVAVKPQMAEAAAASIQAMLSPKTLVLSIMAGKTLADLRRLFPAAGSFVRAMPNLAAAVGRGATVAVTDQACPTEDMERAQALLAGVGSLEWLADETQVNAATAVSGSGPAYVFYLVECLTRAGIEAGLPPKVSQRLSRVTVEGAGELLRLTGEPAEELRASVTSPGGTTAAGLSRLMAGGMFQDLMNATVHAATQRAAELGG